ncbi:MAG: branched-chain amino acid transport system permease protein [Natronomonas sp.]|jgi:branched-chain amino acid transport system permease protein
MADASSILLALLSGLASGMLLFMAAIGLTLVFGVLDVLNFAHGSLYMLGAYVTFFMVGENGFLGGLPGDFWVAAFIAAIVVAVFGALLERFLIRPIYDQDHVFQLLLTFALVLLIDNGARVLWGTSNRSVATPDLLAFQVPILGSQYPAYNLFVIGAGVAVAIGMYLLFERTRIGKVVRASAENRSTAEALGINVPVVFTVVFLFGAALAALGGALAAPRQALQPSMGESVIVETFIVTVIGGLGSFAGALVGSILIGLVGSLAFVFVPRFEPLIPFALLAAVILLRPAGLFGDAEASA